MAFERVKQYKDATIQYLAASTVTLKATTDLDGTGKSIVLPSSSTRVSGTLPLDGLEGNWIKFEATTSGVMKIFGGVYRARPIGEYYDGAKGEKFVTQELGLGV